MEWGDPYFVSSTVLGVGMGQQEINHSFNNRCCVYLRTSELGFKSRLNLLLTE